MNSQSTRGTLAYWVVAVAGVCLLTANRAAATYFSEVAADSPIAFYRMDDASGITISESIAAINGVYQPNDGSSWTGGTLGVSGAGAGSPTAASFNGTTGYGDTADGPFDLDVASGFTLEAWIKTTDTTGLPGIIGKYHDGIGSGYFMVLRDGGGGVMQLGAQIATSHAASAAAYATPTGVTLSDGNWHHVVATHAAGGTAHSSLRLYVDGIERSHTDEFGSGTTGSILNDVTLEIGSEFNAGWGAFAGAIDEVAIYGSALSADRILAHFNAMNPVPEPSTAVLLAMAGVIVALHRRKRL